MLRLYDKINAECAHVIEPDCIVMSIEGVSQLIDELTEEFETNINMENIDQFIGMEVVISNKLFDDYRLARFVNTNDF